MNRTVQDDQRVHREKHVDSVYNNLVIENYYRFCYAHPATKVTGDTTPCTLDEASGKLKETDN